MLAGRDLKSPYSFAILFTIILCIKVSTTLLTSEDVIRQGFKTEVAKTEDKRREEAFSKLELFLPIFPGNPNPKGQS